MELGSINLIARADAMQYWNSWESESSSVFFSLLIITHTHTDRAKDGRTNEPTQ